MRIHKRIKNLTQAEQEQFESYLTKKLEAFAPILEANYKDQDAVHFFAKIQKHHKHTAFAFECILELPRKRLLAGETKHTITEALDFTMQRLEQRMTKYFDRLREPPRRQRTIRKMKDLSIDAQEQTL